MSEVTIPIQYAKNILKVLKDASSFAYFCLSSEVKQLNPEVWEMIYQKHLRTHNANCAPFNRALEKYIEEAELRENEERSCKR